MPPRRKPEEPAPWESGSYAVSEVRSRRSLPMSAKLRTFRELIPDLMTMEVGAEAFVPTYGYEPEEQVVRIAVKRANERRSHGIIFSLIEHRRNIKGRLLICVHRDVASEWAELQGAMRLAMMSNRKDPPLSPEGNAFVPRLRTRPDG